LNILKSKASLALSAALLTTVFGVTGASAASSSNTAQVAVEVTQSAVKNINVEVEGVLKVLATSLRAGGWVLEQALKPLSKSATDKVKRYRFNIAHGLDRAENTTKSCLSTAF
jgi:hypothetical protein